MPPPRLFPGDEELGKKNDDHRPGMKNSMAWKPRGAMPHVQIHKRTAKKMLWAFIVLLAVYLFVKNMPTDLKPPRTRPQYTHSDEGSLQSHNVKPQVPKPHQNGGLLHDVGRPPPVHTFEGPIKFYELAASLHAVSRTKGSEPMNRNVLFAAASLKSAAILLPIACEMAIRERNYVHFALMGRDDISMELLKTVNGLTKECNIIYHDARPDFGPSSSDFRMQVSVSAGFNHINTFVHPQATLIDSSGEEDLFFTKGLIGRAKKLGRTVIELPSNADQSMTWITFLDSASLLAWNKVGVDMLIHAPPKSSGSLIRLLDSLKKADFFFSAPPRLTIELPHDVDEPTRRYLENYKWPPYADAKTGSLLSLHHRIPQRGLSAEENSIRFLETFWPADTQSSHVLVLAPHMELSPLFFHYLKYNILEYKYSAHRATQENMLGISLDSPRNHLNDTATFVAPPSKKSANGGNTQSVSPFLWQAPSSNAALYFGDKWVELHDFVSHILTSQHILPTPATLNEKLVSKTNPSWIEHILKLSRARGYWTLYPNFENQDALATSHHELYHPPDEYAEEIEAESSNTEFTADPTHYLSLKQKEKMLVTQSTKSLLSILPFDGNLPPVAEMPLLSWDGQVTSAEAIQEAAIEYSVVFRKELGGCPADAPPKAKLGGKAADLFCLDNGSS